MCVLEYVGLCLRVAVSLGFADDAVVLEEEHMAVVAPRGGPDAWSPFPHLERPLVPTKTIRQKHDTKYKTTRADWLQVHPRENTYFELISFISNTYIAA